MANDVVPNGIKIEWNHVQNGVPIVNRMYVTMSAAPSSADLTDALGAATAFYNDYKALQHVSCVLNNITVTDVHVANGTQVVLPFTTGNTGALVTAPAAANAAQCVSLRTQFIGRSFRGRYYMGGLGVQNQQDAQNWSTGQTTALAGYFQDFMDALDAINMTLVVVSRFASGVARVVNLATEIINVIVDTKIDSQRRRTAN